MQLNRIDDPRDALEKARRKELERFAEANGVEEVKPGMPAVLMRKILRRNGVTNIRIPNRPLGTVNGNGAVVANDPVTAEPANTVDATDLLEAEYRMETVSLKDLPITELRKMCKAKGIAMERTDKKPDLIGRLNGDAVTGS